MQATTTRAKQFCWLTLLGMPGFVFCAGHICMAGHMQHPPYAWWHIAIDSMWAVLFAAASVQAFRSGLPHRSRLGVLLASLIVSRLLLGSLGGTLFLFELPAAIYLVVVAWRRLRRLRREAIGIARPAPEAA